MALQIASPLFADSIGHLVVEEGMVKLRSKTMDRIIKAGPEEIPIHKNDEIHSGKESRTKIYLNNKNEIVDLFSNTFFNVSSVTSEKSRFYLPVGKIRCKIIPSFSKLTQKRRQFQVRTVNALVSVKGSEMVIQTSGLVTNLLTISGVIAFASTQRPEVEINVTGNQASKTERNTAPTPPTNVPVDVVKTIANEDTATAWEGVEFGDVPKTESKSEAEDSNETGESEETGETEDSTESIESEETDQPEPLEQIEPTEVPTIPDIEEIIPDDIDSARESVSEAQAIEEVLETGDVEVTITFIEE